MGGLASMAIYPTTAGTLRRLGVRHSVSRCIALGRVFLDGVDRVSASSVERAEFIKALGGVPICEGSVDELRPRDQQMPGSLTLSARPTGDVVRMDHQDEFLAVTVNGAVVSRTPEIIVALDSASLRPLRSDEIRLGQNLTVFVLPSMHGWPEPARRLIGADAFGLHLELGD
jgi:DUF917 family protein